MVNCEELNDTAEYLTLYTRCRINRYRYNRVVPDTVVFWLELFALLINPYPTAFPYGNGMVPHFYQQQESSTTKTVHKVINKGLKAYV